MGFASNASVARGTCDSLSYTNLQSFMAYVLLHHLLFPPRRCPPSRPPARLFACLFFLFFSHANGCVRSHHRRLPTTLAAAGRPLHDADPADAPVVGVPEGGGVGADQAPNDEVVERGQGVAPCALRNSRYSRQVRCCFAFSLSNKRSLRANFMEGVENKHTRGFVEKRGPVAVLI